METKELPNNCADIVTEKRGATTVTMILYDKRYKWLSANIGGESCVRCPQCGYYAETHIIKDLVWGEHLAPYCPNCGGSMKREVTG